MAETWISRRELGELIGQEGADLLCRSCGGVPLYVPRKASPRSRLGRLLPPRPLAALVDACGGMVIAVPNGRFCPHKKTILQRLEKGEPHAAIALEVGVTERYVRRLASLMGKNRQLSLL